MSDTSSGSNTPSSRRRDKTAGANAPLENTRLLFQQPTEQEASWYYASFPSCPRLLGLGPHAIHAVWETTTREKAIDAISPLDWTSLDVLRIGQAKLPEHERPVIVWVGIASGSAAPWALVSRVLGWVRRVLDSDGLEDVECGIRVSDVVPAAVPRLMEPAHGVKRLQQEVWEIEASQTISTSIGQSISLQNFQWAQGTLGLYLTPATMSPNTPGAGKETEPVWALTCRHVLFPGPRHTFDEEEEGCGSTVGKGEGCSDQGAPVEVLLPSTLGLKNALQSVKRGVEKTQLLINSLPDDDEQQSLTSNRTALTRQTRLLHRLQEFDTSDSARVIGHVAHAPPIRINVEPAYTRDWALIALHRDKFPACFPFENFVDLMTDQMTTAATKVRDMICEAVGSTEFNFPQDGLLRLNNVIPLREMRGGPIAHQLVTAVDDERYPIVLKRGRTTDVTVGVALDIRSALRTPLGSKAGISFEWAIQHINAKSMRRRGKIGVFSENGDSGSIIFDLTGRVGGLLTSGKGNKAREIMQHDLTYATPMVHVLDDIEKELGVKLRVV